jgi:ATP-binding cassette subfamily B protein
MNSVIQENIAGVRVVKAFVQEKRETDRFNEANDALVQTQLRVLILISWMRPVMNIILNLATVAIIRIGADQVRAGLMAPGTIMAAVTYISQILNGMMMLAMIFQTLSRGAVSWKRLKEVLDTAPALKDGGKEPPEEHGAVLFDHVSFHYPGNDEPVLKDISLDIRPGEFFAVIGSTGCGKSSLVQLIPRFYDASEGHVLVDGMDVKDYDLTVLRERISCVLQKSELFSTTIRDNILLSRPDASEEDVIRAAKTAQAHDFIMRQPQGYDTPVTEQGMSLSGGQRQRTAIARALLKNAKVFIFDDATSALDLKAEAALREELNRAMPDATIIMIAQRISSIMHADRIAVMDAGEIVGLGTHEELMNTCRVYRDIYESQLKGGVTYD